MIRGVSISGRYKWQSRKEYMFLLHLLLVHLRIPFCHCLFLLLTEKWPYQHAADAEIRAEGTSECLRRQKIDEPVVTVGTQVCKCATSINRAALCATASGLSPAGTNVLLVPNDRLRPDFLSGLRMPSSNQSVPLGFTPAPSSCYPGCLWSRESCSQPASFKLGMC